MTADLPEFASDGLSWSEREQSHRREVAGDIVAASYLRGDFLLRSGERSTYYFDKYLFETKPTILRRLATMLAQRVPVGVDRLAGTEVGGIALAAAVSLETGLPFVIIRREGSAQPAPAQSSEPMLDPGEDNLVKGELHAGERVILIQDVVASGTQAVDAAGRVRSLGAQVAGILAVIDREAGGARAIAAAGYHYQPLFTLGDLDL